MAEETNGQYMNRLMNMSDDEFKVEKLRVVNDIRVQEGLAPLKTAEEVDALLNGEVPTPPKRRRLDEMNFWQKLRYVLH